MAQFFDVIDDALATFIQRQKIFFTASAVSGGRVNLSPKGLDCLRILGPKRVAYLDLTGSGNETSAHAEAGGQVTLMFCAFEGAPLILRLYGTATVHRLDSQDYNGLIAQFDAQPGARQIIDLQVQSLQTSCGYGVPIMEFKDQRPNLLRWAEHKGPQALAQYRHTANRLSIDGLPTGWD